MWSGHGVTKRNGSNSLKSMILKYLGYVNAWFTAEGLLVLVAAHLSFAKCGALP